MQMATERTRLFVDGVRSAITADVQRRRHDGIIVTQALPFLKLDTRVVGDDGRPTRISRVAIAMDGDMPRLLLELEHERDEHAAPQTCEAQLSPAELADVVGPLDPGEATLAEFQPGVSTRAIRPDSTQPYEIEAAEPKRDSIVVSGVRTNEPWWQRVMRRFAELLRLRDDPTLDQTADRASGSSLRRVALRATKLLSEITRPVPAARVGAAPPT
jgi:hypothetical protein